MRKSEGPLLALGCLGATIAVLLLVAGALAGSGVVRGLCMIPLGLGFIAVNREFADVAPAFAWPSQSRAFLRFCAVFFGGALVIAGIWEIANA